LFIFKLEVVPLSFVQLPFLRKLILMQNLDVNFPLKCQFMNKFLPMLAKKTKEKLISWALDSCTTFPMSFDL
jgi:hypothetical protein